MAANLNVEKNGSNKKFGGVATTTLNVNNCTLTVSDNAGGNALSWTVDGREMLYQVPKPTFVAGKQPLRCGLPISWPCFGTLPLSEKVGKHGFVRRSNRWKVTKATVDMRSRDSGEIHLEHKCSVDEALGEKPFDFNATEGEDWNITLKVVFYLDSLHSMLTQKLIVTNASEKDCEFTGCFHGYFRIPEGKKDQQTTVTMPNFTAIRDPTFGEDGKIGAWPKFENSNIIFMGEMDGIIRGKDHVLTMQRDNKSKKFEKIETMFTYVRTQHGDDPIKIRTEGDEWEIQIHKNHEMPEVCVWNCGEDKNSRPDDIPEKDVGKFICVEPCIADQIHHEQFGYQMAKAGKDWSGYQELRAVKV